MDFMNELLRKTNYAPKKWNKPFVRGGEDFAMIYFMSKLCSYKRDSGGCTFCTIENRALGTEGYLHQFKYLSDFIQEKTKKNILLFNRNFFDEKELPSNERKELLKEAKKYASKIISIESRPEYITENNINEMRKILGDNLEIDLSIGVETTNDFIRKYNHHKGFNMKEVYQAKKIMDSQGINFVPFVFVKPLFMAEKLAIKDTTKSIEKVLDMGAKRVSIQPMHAYKGSLGGMMIEWKKTLPPNLWSLYQILVNLKDTSKVGVQAINPTKLDPTPDYMPISNKDSFEELEAILTGREKIENAPNVPSRKEWIERLKTAKNIHPVEKLIKDYKFLKNHLKLVAPIDEEQIWRDYETIYSW